MLVAPTVRYGRRGGTGRFLDGTTRAASPGHPPHSLKEGREVPPEAVSPGDGMQEMVLRQAQGTVHYLSSSSLNYAGVPMISSTIIFYLGPNSYKRNVDWWKGNVLTPFAHHGLSAIQIPSKEITLSVSFLYK